MVIVSSRYAYLSINPYSQYWNHTRSPFQGMTKNIPRTMHIPAINNYANGE